MKSTAILALIAAATFAVAGCNDSKGNENVQANEHHDDDGHEHGEEGHEHGEEGHDTHSGEHHALGPVTIGSYQVTIDQIGEVEAGHEIAMEVKLAKAAKGAYVWFGDDSGKVIGAKTRAPDGATQHVHIMVPKDIQASSKLWVEMTEEDGSKNKGSFTPVMRKK